MIGDSHCMSPAWRPIKYHVSLWLTYSSLCLEPTACTYTVRHTIGIVQQDETPLIHPVLSTGTKIWHLREEGVFYPKINFFNEISTIPDDATVVVLLGEIDCREGLHYCVQKCKYDVSNDVYCNVCRLILVHRVLICIVQCSVGTHCTVITHTTGWKLSMRFKNCRS